MEKKLNNKLVTVSTINNLTKIGIYKIFHIEKPDKLYIGSASRNNYYKDCQNGFYKRFLEHLRDLENNKHSSKYLQNVVNKYGIEGIRFEIIEIINPKSKDLILKREQYYLDTLLPIYNSSKVARCCSIPYTEERKRKLSIRMKGNKFPEYVYDSLRKPIYQFSKHGNFITTYNSIDEAANKTKVNRASISKCASGSRKLAGNFRWSFIKDPVFNFGTKIYQYNFENVLINTFESLEEIKKNLNINSSTSIRSCFTGKQKQAYGYFWKKEIT